MSRRKKNKNRPRKNRPASVPQTSPPKPQNLVKVSGVRDQITLTPTSCAFIRRVTHESGLPGPDESFELPFEATVAFLTNGKCFVTAYPELFPDTYEALLAQGFHKPGPIESLKVLSLGMGRGSNLEEFLRTTVKKIVENEAAVRVPLRDRRRTELEAIGTGLGHTLYRGTPVPGGPIVTTTGEFIRLFRLLYGVEDPQRAIDALHAIPTMNIDFTIKRIVWLDQPRFGKGGPKDAKVLASIFMNAPFLWVQTNSEERALGVFELLKKNLAGRAHFLYGLLVDQLFTGEEFADADIDELFRHATVFTGEAIGEWTKETIPAREIFAITRFRQEHRELFEGTG